jgi:hypothetical protein
MNLLELIDINRNYPIRIGKLVKISNTAVLQNGVIYVNARTHHKITSHKGKELKKVLGSVVVDTGGLH